MQPDPDAGDALAVLLRAGIGTIRSFAVTIGPLWWHLTDCRMDTEDMQVGGSRMPLRDAKWLHQVLRAWQWRRLAALMPPFVHPQPPNRSQRLRSTGLLWLRGGAATPFGWGCRPRWTAICWRLPCSSLSRCTR